MMVEEGSGVLISSAIVLLAFAVLFLAVAILFREEIRKVIGFIVAGIGVLFLWNLVQDSLVLWLGVGGLVLLVGYFANRKERERQQATAPKPGQSPAQLAVARLKYQWEHGEIDDEGYNQGLRDILRAYPDSASQ